MDIILHPLIEIVSMALALYVWCIIISAIMSWLLAFNVINSRNRFVAMVGEFLWRITEPALRPIRRFLPNLGGIDISPVVLLLGIIFLQKILDNIRNLI